MLAQIELILEQLAVNGGGWGVAGVLLLTFWRIWKEVKPSLVTWLELRGREVAAAERNVAAREVGNEVARDQAKGTQGLTTAVSDLSESLTAVVNNGFKHITDKLAPDNDAGRKKN